MLTDKIFNDSVLFMRECYYRKQKGNRRSTYRSKIDAYIKQRGKCCFCNKMMIPVAVDNNAKLPWNYPTIEHVEARVTGGGNKRDNIKASCMRCNTTRRDIDFDAFLYICDSVSWSDIKKVTARIHSANYKTLGEVVNFFMTKY